MQLWQLTKVHINRLERWKIYFYEFVSLLKIGFAFLRKVLSRSSLLFIDVILKRLKIEFVFHLPKKIEKMYDVFDFWENWHRFQFLRKFRSSSIFNGGHYTASVMPKGSACTSLNKVQSIHNGKALLFTSLIDLSYVRTMFWGLQA